MKDNVKYDAVWKIFSTCPVNYKSEKIGYSDLSEKFKL